MKIRLCIWMNMPSHHQWDFFNELQQHPDIELVVRYYDRVSQERRKLGWHVDYQLREFEQYVQEPQKALEGLTDWQTTIHIVPGFSSNFLKELLSLLIKHNVPWIHWSERSGRQFAEFLRFHYVFINLFYPLFLFRKGYYAYARKVNQYAKGAFAQGKLAEDDFIKWGIRREKIAHLYYSILPSIKEGKFSEKLKNENYHKFCYAGSLSQRKGTDILLKAFSLLKSAENWKLKLVGPPSGDQDYQKLAKQFKISDRVDFIGAVPAKKVVEYLTACDVFVMPTRFDGWGVVLNEAASLGLPIISTDQCGAAYHLIVNNENGFRIKASSVSELKNVMQRYIDDPALINKHGKSSKEIFKQFLPKKNVERLLKAITNWLNNEDHY